MAELLKFPKIISLGWKSQKIQKWDTKIKTTGSGKVRTMTTWKYPQYTISTDFEVLKPAEYKELMGFYSKTKGGTIPFLWLDPEDNQEKGIQLGTGSEGSWQAVRKFGDFLEPVYHVEDLKLYANGTPIRAVSDKGVIKLAQGETVAPNAVITADYTYYWLVRFSGDMTAEYIFTDVYKSKTFKLVTTRQGAIMKAVNEALRQHLNNDKYFVSCDLYELRLRSGVSYYWADSDADVSYNGQVYKSNGPIIVRDKITTNSTVSVDKMTVSISTNEQDTIGGVPIMAVAHNGGFDGAEMTLRRAFFDESYKIIGVVGLFTGLCEVTQGGGLTLKLNVKSIVQKLNIEYPNRRYYPQCPFSVYSKECGVDIKRFRKSGKVTGLGSGANSIRIDIPFENGYYTAGGIDWLTGPMAGQSTQILQSNDGVILYMSALEVSPRVGDQFYIYAGCNKTPTECKNKFNNWDRNRATPYVPLKESIR